MRKSGILWIMFFCLQQCVFAAEEAAGELNQSLKTHSNEPGIMSIVIALIFVLCLIYVTGIIYSKLNIIGAQTVKEQLKNLDLSKVLVVSTTPLGQNKSLHVIEIDNKRLLVGATQNSITLIKELDKLEKTEEKPVLQEENGQKSLFEEQFDIHKKYL